MTTPNNGNGEPSAYPIADEASPGLGRQSALLEGQRQTSGGLPDDPVDNPVVDSVPFKNLRGEGKTNA